MPRLQIFLCLLVLGFSHTVFAARLSQEFAYYPSDFYEAVENGLEDGELKTALFKILDGLHAPGEDHDRIVKQCPSGKSCYRHTSLGYTEARRMLFGHLHLQQSSEGYAILDVYCERMTTGRDFKTRPPGPGLIPDANVLNAEHTWPQSRFSSKFSKSLQKSDLHILFPVLSNANSARGNIEFGDVVAPLSSPCLASKRGYTASGGNTPYFEVPDSHKGNVARAIFYFSVRYRLPVRPNEEEALRSWNRLDPVDEFERERNEAIFARQHDRNPFVDHPELVELIADF